MFGIDDGIVIKELGLHLDASRRKDLSFISHAHADHVAGHKSVIASKLTARILSERIKKTTLYPMGFNQPADINGYTIELLHAGHILGSSQIQIETKGKRLIYTGDFKVKPGLLAEKIEIRPTDILIMETTYGKEKYILPELNQVVDQITEFIESARKENSVPILFGYSLGKAQDLMSMLGKRGYITSVGDHIYKLAKIHEEFGVKFGKYERFNPNHLEGKVVILPPHLSRTRTISRIKKKKTAILTGWALDKGAEARFGVDTAIPLSNHPDFEELMTYISVSKPSMIYTVHGSPEFAILLNKRGFKARHLDFYQMNLWDDLHLLE